jgi:hypothetical protein
MIRASLIAVAVLCAGADAHAAYKARLLVEPGPLFNAPPVITGDTSYVKVRSDIKPADIEKHLAAPGGVAVVKANDTELVYVADVAGLRGVDARTGALRNVLPLMAADFYPTTVNPAFGGTRLMVGSWISGRVRLIDPATGDVLRK